MLTWMFITNKPEVAKAAYAGGVTRLFVDWEIHNKQERQGHLDTVISQHSYEDAVQIRKAVPDAELLEFLGSWEDQDDWQDFFDAATESDDDALEEKTTNGSATSSSMWDRRTGPSSEKSP